MTDKRELSTEELRKVEAETRKLEQEIELEQAKSEAEILKLKAEARKADFEADQLETVLAVAKLERDAIARLHAETNASDKYNHVYHFTGSVDAGSVDKCVKQLNIWRRTGAKNIEIIFSSGGGSVIDGLELYDFIQILKREGIHVTTGSLGMAASMAGILLQAGNTRWVGKEAWVLIHEIQAGMMGSMGQMEDRIEWLKRIQGRILDIFAERTKTAAEEGTAGKPFSRKTLETNWKRKDWWLSSDECLRGGIVDEVR